MISKCETQANFIDHIPSKSSNRAYRLIDLGVVSQYMFNAMNMYFIVFLAQNMEYIVTAMDSDGLIANVKKGC
jgi:hypothetical protein